MDKPLPTEPGVYWCRIRELPGRQISDWIIVYVLQHNEGMIGILPSRVYFKIEEDKHIRITDWEGPVKPPNR